MTSSDSILAVEAEIPDQKPIICRAIPDDLSWQQRQSRVTKDLEYDTAQGR